MSSHEHKLARALVEAHVAPELAQTVLDAFDSWARVVEGARIALEQQERTEDDLRRFYTVRELRLLLRKSDSGVRALLDDGTLPVTRVAGSIRVPIVAVEAYLREQTSRAEQQPTRPRAVRRSASDAAAIERWPWLED